MTQILTDQIRYLIFSEIYQRYSEPKTRRKALFILENAIGLFDKKGFENVTFLTIARESTIAPQSLRHYFADLEEIRDLSVKYIHLIAQKIIVDSMSENVRADEMLKQYVHGHYAWSLQRRSHLRVWISFLSYGSRSKKNRVLNTKAVLNGAERIEQMLLNGRKEGVFHHENDFETARLIQTIILGWLTSVVSEEDAKEAHLTEQIVGLCLRLTQNETPKNVG